MKILVLGAGTMGLGIAQVAIQSGHRVYLSDPDAVALAQAHERVSQAISREISRGRLPAEAEGWIDERLSCAEPWPQESIDWAIEAAPEREGLKQDLFARLDATYEASVWLASNTSSIALTRLQAKAHRHPERIGGLHFFNPVPRMRLVEIIRGLDTRTEFVEAAESFVEGLGKTAVEAPDRPGFLVNRVARPYYLEALRMVGDGVLPMEDLDQVMEGVGFPMGPFRLMDLVGVDVNFAVTRSVYEQTYLDERYRPHPWQEALVSRGHLGRKSGRGFYRYE